MRRFASGGVYPRRRKAGGSLCLLALLVLAPDSKAGDWPQFRGPNGSGVSDETGLPVRWGKDEGLRWKVELPGRGLSNPVIVGGRVFVTACTGPKQDRLHVLCYDEATGKKLWERQLWATGNTFCNAKTCMAAPTPAADGKQVFALFASGDLAALDRDGDLLWYRSLVRDYPTITNQVGMAASPVLLKNVLLVPMENAGESFAAGLDRHTGKNLWKVGRHRDINWVTPLVFANGDRTDAVFQTNRDLTAYDPETGAVRWTYAAGGPSNVASPVAAGDGLLLMAGGEFTALRPGRDRAGPEVVWKSNRIKTGYTSALVYKGRVYTLNASRLTCTELATGKPLWQELVEGQFSASPVAADGKVYVVNEAGETTVFRVTGEQPEVLARNAVEETILATPAVAGGAIYLRSDRHLYCIGEKK